MTPLAHFLKGKIAEFSDQLEFAAAIGMKPERIEALLHGQESATEQEVKLIAKFTGNSVSYIEHIANEGNASADANLTAPSNLTEAVKNNEPEDLSLALGKAAEQAPENSAAQESSSDSPSAPAEPHFESAESLQTANTTTPPGDTPTPAPSEDASMPETKKISKKTKPSESNTDAPKKRGPKPKNATSAAPASAPAKRGSKGKATWRKDLEVIQAALAHAGGTKDIDQDSLAQAVHRAPAKTRKIIAALLSLG